MGGPVCAGPRDQASVRAVRTAGIRAARRRVPGRVVGAESDHRDLSMAGVARRWCRAGGAVTRAVLEWWAVAVIVRSGYVPLAFGSRRLWAATTDSALLGIVMAYYPSIARQVDPTAAALAVPEIAWTAFATVLSAAVARKNS